MAYGAKVGSGNSVAAASFLLVAFGAVPVQADTARIVALGDSLTAGYGLPPEDGFVPQLQSWLNDRGADVTVVNAGVSGDTTAGALARIDWAVGDDADAVIVTLGGNDLLRGLPPEAARVNLDRILGKIDDKGLPALLVPMTAPGNYGPEYKADFDAIYPELAASHGALLSAPFLDPILTQSDREAAMARYVQPDGLHPSAEGVALVVNALGPRVLELLEEVD